MLGHGTGRLNAMVPFGGAATIALFKFRKSTLDAVRDAVGVFGAAIGLFPFGNVATVGDLSTVIGLLGAAIGLFTFSVGGLNCCGDSFGACPAAGIEDTTASVATVTAIRIILGIVVSSVGGDMMSPLLAHGKFFAGIFTPPTATHDIPGTVRLCRIFADISRSADVRPDPDLYNKIPC